MTFQMTTELANQYALRMFNDDYWNKFYSINSGKPYQVNTGETWLVIPMLAKIGRYCVGEDDDQEYADRIDAMDEDLADDDHGDICLSFELTFERPSAKNAIEFANADSETILNIFNIMISNYSQATMCEGKVVLSDDALDHVLGRIGQHYIILDSIEQNKELILNILNEALGK